MEQGALPQVMLLEAVTEFWLPRNPGVSGAVHTPGTHRAALWSPVAVATWLLLPSESEHSDQATHRLGKLTARARPLPTSSSFCQVYGGIREGRPLHPGSRGGD